MMKFVDLQAQQERIAGELREAVARVLAHGQFVMGEEVEAVEAELGRFCGARNVISCASGTDALLMALLAYEVGAGDAVLVPSFTFVASAEVVQLLGATPIFVDVEAGSFNMDAGRLGEAIEYARGAGLRVRGVIAVDLFGLPADYEAIGEVARAEGLFVLADSAQSFGARRGGKMAGTFGDVSATSFFPAKPLGCYGDGGAVFTEDDGLAEVLRSVRVHGMGGSRYEHVRTGITGRLDTLQAAVLLCKLKIFAGELEAREGVARGYAEGLGGVEGVVVPRVGEGCRSAWAQYTLRVERRDELREFLGGRGIPSAVYYPVPLHLQGAFRGGWREGAPGLGVSEGLAGEVVSLPMHAYLEEGEVGEVVGAVREFFG